MLQVFEGEPGHLKASKRYVVLAIGPSSQGSTPRTPGDSGEITKATNIAQFQVFDPDNDHNRGDRQLGIWDTTKSAVIGRDAPDDVKYAGWVDGNLFTDHLSGDEVTLTFVSGNRSGEKLTIDRSLTTEIGGEGIEPTR